MQKETLCLGLLSLGPRSGYEIKQMFEGPLSDFYSLSFGTIYPTLNSLQADKYVSCKQHSQSKKPDKKVYTITKKGMDLLKDNLLGDASSYIRSGNFGDQIKSEFFLLLLFSKYIPNETMNTVLNERVLYLRQKLEQFKYDGPVPGNLDAIRNEKSVSFIRGLASALIETGLNYMEKNRHLLKKKPN